jgi:hypothetical protein
MRLMVPRMFRSASDNWQQPYRVCPMTRTGQEVPDARTDESSPADHRMDYLGNGPPYASRLIPTILATSIGGKRGLVIRKAQSVLTSLKSNRILKPYVPS